MWYLVKDFRAMESNSCGLIRKTIKQASTSIGVLSPISEQLPLTSPMLTKLHSLMQAEDSGNQLIHKAVLSRWKLLNSTTMDSSKLRR